MFVSVSYYLPPSTHKVMTSPRARRWRHCSLVVAIASPLMTSLLSISIVSKHVLMSLVEWHFAIMTSSWWRHRIMTSFVFRGHLVSIISSSKPVFNDVTNEWRHTSVQSTAMFVGSRRQRTAVLRRHHRHHRDVTARQPIKTIPRLCRRVYTPRPLSIVHDVYIVHWLYIDVQ